MIFHMVFMGTKIGQCQEFSTILVNIIVNFNNLTRFGDNFGGRAPAWSFIWYLSTSELTI